MVDKDLRGNFDRIELEEIVQVALLCTQYFPKNIEKHAKNAKKKYKIVGILNWINN